MVVPARSLQVAGKYELLEEIARGGMGTVWRARSKVLDVDCAVKMLLSDPRASDARQSQRLIREARIAARLHSPYIVTVHDVGEWEGGPFIAMELLEGRSLRQWLEERKTLSIPVTVELVRQLALALDKAHAAGLVHRDLKPDNIYIVEEWPLLAKVLDFGIAKDTSGVAAGEVHTTTGTISGTPLYMSPEQANGAKNVDFRSDLWSLAVICFECLTGKTPFLRETFFELMLAILRDPLPLPSQLRVDLPPAFDALWARAASRDPEARPGSALAFAEAVRAVFADELSAEAELEPMSAPPLAKTSRRSGAGWLLPLVAAAIVLAAAGGILWRQRQPGPTAQHSAPSLIRADAIASSQSLIEPTAVPTPLPVRRTDSVSSGQAGAAAQPARLEMSAEPSKPRGGHTEFKSGKPTGERKRSIGYAAPRPAVAPQPARDALYDQLGF